ncbi:MAG: hypothetical protein ACAI44_04760 [Candidatus Sericytochromatia bacterium]
MANITGSFVSQQIQNLNQLKTQQAPQTEQSRPSEPSIGKSVFQARQAMFEKNAPKDAKLGDDRLAKLESGLITFTSKDLNIKLGSFRPKGLQREQELSETESDEQGIQPSQPRRQAQEVESESNQTEGEEESPPQVSQPAKRAHEMPASGKAKNKVETPEVEGEQTDSQG